MLATLGEALWIHAGKIEHLTKKHSGGKTSQAVSLGLVDKFQVLKRFNLDTFIPDGVFLEVSSLLHKHFSFLRAEK